MSPNKGRSSSTPKTHHLLKTLFSASPFHLSCGGCTGSAALPSTDVYQPLPIQPKTSFLPDVGSPTFSLDIQSSASPRPSKVGESVAIVKESDDPYLDFRHSMLQMILEKEIFSKEDLQDLLACFLRLNLPSHHDDIIHAFSDIWGAVMSPDASHAAKRPSNFGVTHDRAVD